MAPRALTAWVVGWVVACALLGLAVRHALKLDLEAPPSGPAIVSLWRDGERFAREVGDPGKVLADDCPKGCTRLVERIVDSKPFLFNDPLLMSLSVVAGRDGVSAQLGERTVYLTPTDLLKRGVSRGEKRFGLLNLRIGFDDARVVPRLLAAELGVKPARLLAEGNLRRFVVSTSVNGEPARFPRRADPEDVTVESLRTAIVAASSYLVRNQRSSGRFLYDFDALTGKSRGGYNWPRHAGATLFLAEAAAHTGKPEIRKAAVRAGRALRDVMARCGEHRCVGDGRRVDLGSSALAALAFVELVDKGIDPSFAHALDRVVPFIAGQQRDDGEFMHFYDRRKERPVDVQVQYYTGEAALALARAGHLLERPELTEAASAALDHLVDESWSFFGSRYFFGAEHWTCQALESLWEVAPSRAALRFCLDYHRFNRRVQFGEGDPTVYDGGFGPNPFFPPRLTSASSRSEAAVATLTTAVAAGVERAEVAALDGQIRRSLAFVLRHQLMPGPHYILPDPLRSFGGVPGSPTDLSVRIDYPQHAGSAMVRYARYLDRRDGD